MSTITKLAREMLKIWDVPRRTALALASAVPAGTRLRDCDLLLAEDGDADLLLPGYVADDGNAEVAYPQAGSGLAAARQYVADGDWNDAGSVRVYTWRKAIKYVAHGDDSYEIDADGREAEECHDIDIPTDHARLIQGVVPRGEDHCGTAQDDHDWSSEGEGGCRQNPGVWSLGGTTILTREHCTCCGLRREVTDRGSQRNPGEAQADYEYSWDHERVATTSA